MARKVGRVTWRGRWGRVAWARMVGEGDRAGKGTNVAETTSTADAAAAPSRSPDELRQSIEQ